MLSPACSDTLPAVLLMLWLTFSAAPGAAALAGATRLPFQPAPNVTLPSLCKLAARFKAPEVHHCTAPVYVAAGTVQFGLALD